MYKVIMQYIPGIDQIWVSKLNPDDQEYAYDVEQDAIDKAIYLQSQDTTGRLYKVKSEN